MATVAEAVLESRENVPLQSGKRHRSNLCPCSEDYFSSYKFINSAFGTLTVIITAALLLQIYYGDYQVVPHGSVATDSVECSKIGTSILKQRGNSVDAAIASAFCLTVVAPHLTSLDGGGQFMVYNHRTRITSKVIDFERNGKRPDTENLPNLVEGLAFVHQQYASLPWRVLVQPAADLARKGFLIPKMLVLAIKAAKVEDLFGHLEAGQILSQKILANTLDTIANISEEQLDSYVKKSRHRPTFSDAIETTFNNYDIYVPDSPSSGPLLVSNLVHLEGDKLSGTDVTKPDYLFKIVDITQKVINSNVSAPFITGTSTNVAVMDLDDNYVSFITGLFAPFGSGEMTQYGYVLDVKNTFGQRSSRLPIIITNTDTICGRRLILGASDVVIGSQLVISLLAAGNNVTDAVEAPRFHFLGNGSIALEETHSPTFGAEAVEYLRNLTRPIFLAEPYVSSNVVEKIKDDLSSHSDSRGGGISSRF